MTLGPTYEVHGRHGVIDIEHLFVMRWTRGRAGCLVRPALLGPRLRAGDRIRVVSPASTPERDVVARGVERLESWGLGADSAARFSSTSSATIWQEPTRTGWPTSMMPSVTQGSELSSRPLVGKVGPALPMPSISTPCAEITAAHRFGDITFLHQALYRHCCLATLHGPHLGWDEQHMGPFPAEGLRRAMMTTEPIALQQQPEEASSSLTTTGRATGTLIGGNLRGVGQSIGWAEIMPALSWRWKPST